MLGYKSVKRDIIQVTFCLFFYTYKLQKKTKKKTFYLLKQAQSCLGQLTKPICIFLQYLSVHGVPAVTLKKHHSLHVDCVQTGKP